MRENEKLHMTRPYTDFRVADKRPRGSRCYVPFISNFEISSLLMFYQLHENVPNIAAPRIRSFNQGWK
jgi:hypothetical protein